MQEVSSFHAAIFNEKINSNSFNIVFRSTFCYPENVGKKL